MPDEPQTDTIRTSPSEKAFPADLAVVLVWLAAALLVVYLPLLNETPLVALIILPGILFFPGYCLIAALFPKDSDIDLTERIALSCGLSIATVPLIALMLNFTPFGIRLTPLLVSVTAFILATILIAYYRRTLLPVEKRFRFPFSLTARTIREMVYPKGDDRTSRLLAVAINVTFIIAVLVTIYAIAVPKEGERFTEFFILGQNQTATHYPDRIIVGQDYPMYVGIGNHEYRTMNYTIESWFVRSEFDILTNTSHLIAMDPGERLAVTLEHNETRIIPYTLTVRKATYNRVEFLVFNESPPGPDVAGNDRIDASYRNVNLWIRAIS